MVKLDKQFDRELMSDRPIYSTFTTRWGYGGRILDLNPMHPHGRGVIV